MTTDDRLKNLNFLFVDDSRVAVKMVLAMLQGFGITNVDTAASATEAEEKIAAKKYDAVFLDWRMQGKSGVALMEQYRADRAFDNVAFVIVSGESGDRYIHEAMKAGASAYIVKPFTADVLKDHLAKVEKWLEQRGRFGAAT